MGGEQAVRRSSVDTSSLNILVVDDEEIMRSMVRDVLADAGYNVYAAASGQEALEEFKKREFGIVVTDIRMPGMDGVQVTQKFKSLNSDVCVIAITGYASIQSAVAILKEGAYDYINKPFDIDDIKVVISRAAERQVLLKQAREKEKFEQLSIIDGLTELYNRRYFDEMTVKEFNAARDSKSAFSILMIDVDHFKSFNDSNGHQAGDWALKRVAQVIAGSVRGSDSGFRYGGEEFAILLPGANKVRTIDVAKRLRINVSLAKFLDKTAMPRMHMTISVGLATFPDDAGEIEQLIRRADENLYRAKELGRDRICFIGVNNSNTEVK